MSGIRKRHGGTTGAALALGLIGLVAAVTDNTAAQLPLGHPDFHPSDERPIGYRGDGTGHFPGATPPLAFSQKEASNVRWSIRMPGWGQSSPVAVGKRVIAAAEPDTTLCVDADTGRALWQDSLGLFEKDWTKCGGHVFLWSGFGYSWPCSDGERVFKAWIGLADGSQGGGGPRQGGDGGLSEHRDPEVRRIQSVKAEGTPFEAVLTRS